MRPQHQHQHQHPRERKSHLHPHPQPQTLRGHLCLVCNALGEHLTTACPARHSIGLPRHIEPRAHAPAHAHAHAQTSQLAPAELLTAVHANSQHLVPAALRCCGCWMLAREPVWLPCCDAVACVGCLGPIECPWTCPVCHDALHDGDVHIVGALRELAACAFETIARRVDAGAGAKAASSDAIAATPVAKPMALDAKAASPVAKAATKRRRAPKPHAGAGRAKSTRASKLMYCDTEPTLAEISSEFAPCVRPSRARADGQPVSDLTPTAS